MKVNRNFLCNGSISRNYKRSPQSFKSCLFRGLPFLPLLLFLLTGCGAGTTVTEADHPLQLTSLDGQTDTISFHIGSPLFLRVPGEAGRGCEPGNGQFFIFGERNAQLGWGFREVIDTNAFPPGACTRYLMLPSEESNSLAEGYYRVSVALLLDEKSRRTSDTVVLHPIHAESASTDSYAQFLLEQLVVSSPMLRNESTVSGLFAEHLPQGEVIDLYEALIRYRIGDLSGARAAYSKVTERATHRFGPYPEALFRRLGRLLGR